MRKINITINKLKINYITKGKGKAVLIIPGWGTTINTYMTLINDISTYANVYCLDMPGFGESQEPITSWDVDEYVEFIESFIESQDIKELDLIGHSNGGRIIIKLMSKQKLKFKVNKIILMGSAGIVHKLPISKRLKVKCFKALKKIVEFKAIKKLFPNLLLKIKNKFGSEDYRKASQIMKQTLVKLINEDVREYLPNIKVPTLLIWGENDAATPIEDAKLMEKLIPDSGLLKIPNCSHYVFLERANYINKIIKVFILGR